MKSKLTGKQIDSWVNENNTVKPCYWGDKYDWSYKTNSYTKRVNGAFIAKKYNAIVGIAIETKAKIKLTPLEIVLQYENGQSKINRDALTDSFLLPLININVGFNEITN